MIRSSRPRTLRVVTCAFVIGAAAAGEARAQPPAADPDPARSLFFEARSLMEAQRWDEARVRLERSEALRPGKGTEFHLAECYERLGRPAAAWALFEKVATESKAAGLTEHEALARQRADAVASRVPRLGVDVAEQAGVDGLQIQVDGARVAVDDYGRLRRVEPGHHHVFAAAPQRAALDVEIDLDEGENRVVRVPRLTQSSSAQSPGRPEVGREAAAKVDAARPAGADARPDPGAGWRTTGIIVGATGLAALAVGGIFEGLSLGSRGSANQWCNTSTGECTSTQGVSDLSSAVNQGNIATGFAAAGAVLLAAGAVLWFASPRAGNPVAVGLSACGGAGITLRGGF